MKRKIYLDYQSTTPVSEIVLKKMMPFFREKFANPHSNNHTFGREVSEIVENSRLKVADLINAEPNEIIFTSGATESNNLAIKSIAQNYFNTDFQVITAKTEHKCVLESCHYLEEQKNKVHYLDVNEDGLIDLNSLEVILKDKPTLISIMHANNEIGVLQPLMKIGELCKKYNAIFHSDIAQSIGSTAVDVKSLNLHAASISGHKIYGPKGIGALYLSKSIKNILKPLIDGGGQEMGIRSGTLSPALCVGLGESCEDLKKNLKKYCDHFKKLKSIILSKLINSDIDFEINGNPNIRIPNNLNIRIKNKEALVLFNKMPHIALSTGSACSSGTITRSHVLSALKLNSRQIDESFRISFGRETSSNDIKELISQLEKY